MLQGFSSWPPPSQCRRQYDVARECAEQARAVGALDEQGRAIALLAALAEDRDRPADRPAMQLLRLSRQARGSLELGVATAPPTREQVDRLGRLERGHDEGALFDARLPPLDDSLRVRMYHRRLWRHVARVALLMALDVAALTMAVAVSLGLKAFIQGTPASEIGTDVLLFLRLAGPFVPFVALGFGLYRADAERAQVPQILATMTTVAVGTALLPAFDRPSLLGTTTVWVSLVLAVLVCWMLRSAYDGYSRRWVRTGQLQARVVLLGTTEQVYSLAPVLREGANGQRGLWATSLRVPTMSHWKAGLVTGTKLKGWCVNDTSSAA